MSNVFVFTDVTSILDVYEINSKTVPDESSSLSTVNTLEQ